VGQPGRSSLLEVILAWGRAEPAVEALVLTGSAGRQQDIDEFSDLDVEVVASDVDTLAEGRWIGTLGDVMVGLDLEHRGYPSKLIFFDGGTKVDFTICDRSRIDEMTSKGLDDLYERGYKVLYDPQGVTRDLPPARQQVARVPPPMREDYDFAVAEFFFEAAHMPACLLRHELWVAHFRDWTMKCNLLKMIEWQAGTRGAEDMRIIGKHMVRWVEPHTWEHLHEVFGHFDAADTYNAMWASIELFRRLAIEVAAARGFSYPASMDHKVCSYLSSFSERVASA
jgi:aminoglycoside 6-adenylyltransferase